MLSLSRAFSRYSNRKEIVQMDKTLLDVLKETSPKTNSGLVLALLQASEESNQQKDKHIAVLKQDLSTYHKEAMELKDMFKVRKATTKDGYYIEYVGKSYTSEILVFSQSEPEAFEKLKTLLHLDMPNEESEG